MKTFKCLICLFITMVGVLQLYGRCTVTAETVISGSLRTQSQYRWGNNNFPRVGDVHVCSGRALSLTDGVGAVAVAGRTYGVVEWSQLIVPGEDIRMPVEYAQTGRWRGITYVATDSGTWTSDYPNLSTPIQPGDVILNTVWWGQSGNIVAYKNGVLLGSRHYSANNNHFLYSDFRWTARDVSYVPPTVTVSPATALVGEPVNWVSGVSGYWGSSGNLIVPPNGRITNLSLTGNTYPPLSFDGITYQGIGHAEFQFLIEDGHAIDTVTPMYTLDTTSTTATNTLTVKTTAKPILTTTYASLAVASDATPLSGLPYSADAPIFIDDEDGWTKQPLDIRLDPDTIIGTFDTVLRLPDFNTITTNAVATRTNYHIESPNALGTPISGVLTQVGVPTNELSAVAFGFVKIDKTAPIPGVTFYGGSTFEDDSHDALSGISITRPSKIAFSAVGGAQPAAGAFTTFDSISVSQGNYDVWVQATDKAGNVSIAMVQSGVFISGEVIITKDTALGATLHTRTCDNHDLITTELDCAPSCSIGANIEVTGATEMTYQLTIENTDTALMGKGDFLDYLPLGTELIGTPTITTSGAETVTITTTTKLTSGQNAGRWQIAGDYENLAPGDSFLVSITCSVPTYDTTAGASNIISNQATGTWELSAVSSGTMESNFANHRVNPSPTIIKASNWGNATHTETCISSTSLTLTGSCHAECASGNSGYIQAGDILSYQLTFENPSNILQYFATNGGARNYDVFQTGVDATNQTITIDLVDAGGNLTNQYTGTVAPGATGTIYTGSWPDADGNYLSGLAVTANRIYQNAGTISVAPKSKLIITVGAKITGNPGDILTNQAITGHSVTGTNSNALTLTDTGVTTIRSNHVTHRIEEGTTLRKWAYSNTVDANNPTVHAIGCPDSSNLLVPGTCLGCTLGSAKLQKDTIITYSLTMDNTKNLHKGSNLAGTIAVATPIPGGYTDNKHADVVMPEGLTVNPATLRAYVTDRNGASVPITNGSGTFSSPQSVNENGVTTTREVLTLSGTNIDIKDTGEGTNIFTLSNISLTDTGTRWELTLDNRAYASGSTNDYTGYSITYLFDATVTGEHDSVTIANNSWVNHWKQDNGNRVHNPENPAVGAVLPTSILSNSVVHARLSDAVDTLFTKVGADNLTQGLSGAHFALYQWDGTNPPTDAQARHIVDSSVLIDTATLPAGQWVRVKANAALATLSDIFTSSNIPSNRGEVDLGKLPTGTYTLIETKAPSGYALPVGQWIITIDSDKTDTGVDNWKIEIVGKTNSIAPPAAIRDESVPNAPSYKIVNAEPFLIGLSGLGGTTGMLLAGFVIMAGVGNIYLVWRHKRGGKTHSEQI